MNLKNKVNFFLLLLLVVLFSEIHLQFGSSSYYLNSSNHLPSGIAAGGDTPGATLIGGVEGIKYDDTLKTGGKSSSGLTDQKIDFIITFSYAAISKSQYVSFEVGIGASSTSSSKDCYVIFQSYYYDGDNNLIKGYEESVPFSDISCSDNNPAWLKRTIKCDDDEGLLTLSHIMLKFRRANLWTGRSFTAWIDYVYTDLQIYNFPPMKEGNLFDMDEGKWDFINDDPIDSLTVEKIFYDVDGEYYRSDGSFNPGTLSGFERPSVTYCLYRKSPTESTWTLIDSLTTTASTSRQALSATFSYNRDNTRRWNTNDELLFSYSVTDGLELMVPNPNVINAVGEAPSFHSSILTVPNWPASATWGSIPSEIMCTTDISTTSATNYISVTLSDKPNSVDTDAVYYIEVKSPGASSYTQKETGSWTDGQILKIPYGWFASSEGLASLKVSFHDGYDTTLKNIEKTDVNVKNTAPTVSWDTKPSQGANGEICSAIFLINDDTFIPIVSQIQFQYQKVSDPAVWYDIVSPIDSVDITETQSLSMAVITNPSTNAYGPIPANILGEYTIRLTINDGFGKQSVQNWIFTVTDTLPKISAGPYLYVRDSTDNVIAYLDTHQDWYHWDGANWVLGEPSENTWLTKNVKLQAVMNYEDPDGQEMVVRIQFKRNGALWGDPQIVSKTLSGFTSSSVTGFQHGDIITYTYEPITLPSTSIGIFTFPIAVIIQDILPVVDSYQINPSSDAAFTDTSLSVENIAISDADGDTCAYSIEWSINGLIQSNTGPILAASNFYSGQTIQLRITPKSIVGTNQISGESVVVTWLIHDRPPTVTNVVYPSKPTKSSDLTLSITTADLDDNDPATISIYPRSATITWQRWDNELWTDVMVSTANNLEGSKVITATLSNSYFEKGDLLRALIVLRNGHSENPSPELYMLFTTTDLVIYNTPSAINDLVYLNSDLNQLYYSSYINAEVEISDIDSSDLTNLAVKFDWYKVGNSIPIWTDLSSHIESYAGRYWIQSALNNTEMTRFVHGDSLYVVATAYDGVEWGNMLSTSTSPVFIHNTAPCITDILWPSGPHTIHRGDTWVITPVVQDVDPDDTTSQHLRFNVQFTILTSAGTTRIFSYDNVATIELSDEYFAHGDQITVQLTPFNFGINENDQAYLYGSRFTMDPVPVVNSLPTLSLGELSPVSASVDCNASLNLIDVDGDIVSAQFEWSVNKEIIAGQITASLPCQYYKRGDEITLRLRLSDNYDYEFTDWIYLNSIQVQNDPPVIVATQIGVIGDYIDQSQVFRDDILNLTLTSTDYDADSVSYYYQWYANGLPVEGATEATFNVTLVSPGSVIFCRITPWDGYSNGTSVDTASITVIDAGRYESVDLSMFLRMNPTQMYYFFGLMFATMLLAAISDKIKKKEIMTQ